MRNEHLASVTTKHGRRTHILRFVVRDGFVDSSLLTGMQETWRF